MEFTQGLQALSVELNGGSGVDARVTAPFPPGPVRPSRAPAGEGSGGGAAPFACAIRCFAPPRFTRTEGLNLEDCSHGSLW